MSNERRVVGHIEHYDVARPGKLERGVRIVTPPVGKRRLDRRQPAEDSVSALAIIEHGRTPLDLPDKGKGSVRVGRALFV